jgi:hypothetical protein
MINLTRITGIMPMSGRCTLAYLCTCLNLGADCQFNFAVRSKRA